jgi:N-acyl homoserine lactone hydrolase
MLRRAGVDFPSLAVREVTIMRTGVSVLVLVLVIGIRIPVASPQGAAPKAPNTPRLYIFDCGLINVNRAGTERYKVTPEEVGETRFSVPCFLVVHPKGTLMWDLGIVPDDTVEARARGEQGNTTATSAAVAPVTRTLTSQLAALGYRLSDITYFAFSHAHVDHNANANLFAGSTWLARPAERAFMWQEGNTRVNRTFFEKIRTSKSISLDRDEYDVFGDGTVVLKAAPGHSPGHQVLVLNLAKTGRVMIAGDLYHYPQERTLKRPPPDTEFSVEQSAASRLMIEEYLKKTKTEIWIEHDFVHNAKLKKSPQYYE